MPEQTNTEEKTMPNTQATTDESLIAQARAEGAAEAANAFVEWGRKNEIAEPPLDWKWFGEIARRYSPLHEEHGSDG